MIVTVTLNSALDRTIFIEEFCSGTTMRSESAIDCVGGKGFITSAMLHVIGEESLSIGIVAGSTGKLLEQMLEDLRIHHDLIWVEGESRIAHVIVETRHQRHSHVTCGGYVVTPAVFKRLLKLIATRMEDASWLIVSGSIPNGVPIDSYGRIVELAHQKHVPTLIDCSGRVALQALPVRPDIVKMNHTEFAATFDVPDDSRDRILEEASNVRRQYDLRHLVLTCGEQGLLAFDPTVAFLVRSPILNPVNAAGAGDAVSAAMVWKLCHGDSWEEALKWGAAVGAASVLTQNTAEFDMEVARSLYQKVEFVQL